MLSTQEKIDAIGNILKRQVEEENEVLQTALDASSIDYELYTEVRGIAQQMALFALKQKEERVALFAIIKSDPDCPA